MPFTTKAPGEYSTNPNTIKARLRKMNLSGAQKVEDAARTADYKAMIYARKTVQAKPEYTRASDSEKSAMLTEAMLDTMEKRRARGQDTMSKMAAFRAGTYRDRDGVTGPKTRVPISAFLEDNGFVPSRPGRGPQRIATAGSSNTDLANRAPLTLNSLGPAPEADMDDSGSAFAGADRLSTSAIGQSGPALLNLSPHQRADYRPGSAPAPYHARSNNHDLESQIPASSAINGVKVDDAAGSFGGMSPEPMLASIEGDVSMTDANESLARLQAEMGHLRTICQNAVESNNNIREVELHNVEAKMGIEKNRMRDLEVRVSQLEGRVHALQNTSLSNIVDRVNELESIMEELKSKVGSGCDAEVAKMREVMRCLKGAIDKFGGFV